MEYLQKILKKSGQASIVESIIFAILGIILIANPEETVKVISYILGAGLIIVGIFQILNYIKMNGQSDLYNYHLIYGIMTIVIGIITIIYSATIGSIFRIIIGIWIIIAGVTKFQLAFNLRGIDSKWIVVLLSSIISIILGVLIILNPFSTVMTITVISGIILFITEICNLIESAYLLIKLK